MCCRISKLCTRIRGYKGLAYQVLLRAHTRVFQKKTHSLKVAPKDQRLHGIGRRTAAVSIHMCVWQNHMSTQGLHQGSKRYKSLADQLLLRAYTYVCQKQPVPGCTQGSQIHGTGRPTARICQVKVAPKGQGIQVFGRLCCCEHTHVCCRVCQFRVAPKWGCRSASTCCCEHTNVCVRISQLRVARVAPKDHGLHCFGWPITTITTNTHVCFRTSHLKIAPQNQGLHRFRQPSAAVSMHMCAAE